MQDFGRMIADARAYYDDHGTPPLRYSWGGYVKGVKCYCPLVAACRQSGGTGGVSEWGPAHYGLTTEGIVGFLAGYDGEPQAKHRSREYADGYEAGLRATEVMPGCRRTEKMPGTIVSWCQYVRSEPCRTSGGW